MDIIGKKWWFLGFSLLVIIPGIISLLLWGIKPSIDFTGGTLYEFRTSSKISSSDEIRSILGKAGVESGAIQSSGENTYLIRLKPLNREQSESLGTELSAAFDDVVTVRSETVGPSVGRETAGNAVKAVLIASGAIIFYIAFAFRKIPKPYSSYRFGISAVVAFIHDILVICGLFSIFGHFFKVEVDSLFITALLTIMGFSVHDTIVVFDRIRENLYKMRAKSFHEIVNESLLQTMVRSISTSLTVLFTLFAMYLFGGETIRWFIVALLIGIISGTYSSIFNAAPILVLWEERISASRK